MAVDRKKVEWFRNLSTGTVWAANPGSYAHKRMTRGVAAGDYERADPPKSTRKAAPKSTGGE